MVDIYSLNKEASMLPTKKAIESEICTIEWEKYIEDMFWKVDELSTKEAAVIMISEQNWQDRAKLPASDSIGLSVNSGDICFIEFGRAFVLEAGYQHFGLVMGKCNGKVFVIPMTSNKATYEQAYDPVDNPIGKKHLMRLGLIEGMTKPSVLFLNDAKFMNSARVISTVAHLDTSSVLFNTILFRVMELLFFSV